MILFLIFLTLALLVFIVNNYRIKKYNYHLLNRCMNAELDLEEAMKIIKINDSIIEDISNLKNEKYFARSKVISIIDELLERPDVLMDAVQNENTDYSAEDLLEIALGKQ